MGGRNFAWLGLDWIGHLGWCWLGSVVIEDIDDETFTNTCSCFDQLAHLLSTKQSAIIVYLFRRGGRQTLVGVR